MKIFPDDPRQRLRFRRSLLAAGAGVLLSLLILVADEYRMVRLHQSQIVWLLVMFWIGNLVFLSVMRSGLNLRFQDPSLTMAQIIWATSCVMFITYFIYDVQAAFLMMCLLVVNFGGFRLNLIQLLFVAVYATAGYALVVFLLYVNHPEIIGLQLELFKLAGFAAALFGSTLVGHEMYVLRTTLRDRNKQLEGALEKVNLLAVTDELTNVYNRRYFDEVLKRNVALARRGDYHFSVCFFDLDHFKQVNDTYGHAVGDQILVKTAEIATTLVRSGDILARYGGEEFVIVLTATRARSAIAVAERIRETMASTKFDALGPDGRVTVSCGVAEYRPPEELEELLTRADQAMYAAKKAGRNKVVRAPDRAKSQDHR